jgi:hypothetical protein
MAFDKEKFKGLVHYICWKCDAPSKLGAIKLNKILWFADIQSFAETGAPITGAAYVKRRLGPVPKPILPALREMEIENVIRIEEVEYYGRSKKQYISLVEPNLSLFSPEQLRLVDAVLHTITHGHTANSVSEATHDDIWKLANEGEEIPYYAVFASKLGKITEQDKQWALERVRVSQRSAE